jgi:hypothetical protein
MPRGANPRLRVTPSVAVSFRISVPLAERLRELVLQRDCSVPQLIEDGITALEAQQHASEQKTVAA